jgi:hypothetical protein
MKVMKYKTIYILIIVVFCISGILASVTDITSVINNLSIDTVDIVLSEGMIKDNKKTKFVNGGVVVPGQNISLIPNISNVGVDCFVRIKLETDSLSYSDFEGFNKKWKFNPLDNYFYYTEVLNEEKSIEVFQSFTIPSSWNNEMADKKFNVDLIAEAIQSRNFYPNFNSEDPWNGQEAEKTVRTRLDRKLVIE